MADGDKSETKKMTTAAPATAAGQALGYSLQYTRLTALLLTAPEGSACSLEVLDDIDVESNTGERHLVQSKSSLGANPVSDRAISLWKTLFNWMQLVQRGFVRSDNAIFELYVSRPVNGPVITAFSEAITVEKARAAIDLAKQTLWGLPPDFPMKAKLAGKIGKYANQVLEADEDIVLPIIVKMRLECGSGSPQADLEAIIRSHPVSQAKVRMIADHICGWVKTRIDERLEQSLPGVIARDDSHTAYTSFCRGVDRDAILRSLARHPTNEEALERLPDIFVQQLDLIDLPFEEKLGAISDFLRACWDRAKWAKAGDVDETSFDELDHALARKWQNHSRANKIEYADKPEADRGKLLYTECMLHNAMVQGMTPPAHFVPGCFHRLADEQHVGWHPEFRKLLKRTPVAS
jgi:hypothetical protein